MTSINNPGIPVRRPSIGGGGAPGTPAAKTEQGSTIVARRPSETGLSARAASTEGSGPAPARAGMAPRTASASSLKALSATRILAPHTDEATLAAAQRARTAVTQALADPATFHANMDGLMKAMASPEDAAPSAFTRMTPKEKGETIKLVLSSRGVHHEGKLELGDQLRISPDALSYAISPRADKVLQGTHLSSMIADFAPLLRTALLEANEALGKDKADLSLVESGKAYKDLGEAVRAGMPYDKACAAFKESPASEYAARKQATTTATALRYALGAPIDAVMQVVGLPPQAHSKVAYESTVLGVFSHRENFDRNIVATLKGLAGDPGVDNDFSRMTPAEKGGAIKTMLATPVFYAKGQYHVAADAPPKGKFETRANLFLTHHSTGKSEPLLRDKLIALNEGLGKDKADLSDVISGKVYKDALQAVKSGMPYRQACHAFGHGPEGDYDARDAATDYAHDLVEGGHMSVDDAMKRMGLPEEDRARVAEGSPYIGG